MTRDLLLVRSGRRLCALPVEHVDETMRPMPIEALPDVPTFVRGLAIVRGRPTPIVDLRTLLGDDEHEDPTRLVTLRINGTRHVGVLVDEVLGIREKRTLHTEDMPSLLQDAAADIVQELARLDGRLLTILRTGSLIPEEVWLLARHGKASQ
jgi:purine-binding chemotaxis protein CheW